MAPTEGSALLGWMRRSGGGQPCQPDVPGGSDGVHTPASLRCRRVFRCRCDAPLAWAERFPLHLRRVAGARCRSRLWPRGHRRRWSAPSYRWGRAGEPVHAASWSARCSMSRSRMWMADSKMMLRSVGRQGCGQVLAALDAPPSGRRSLTVTGPARTSPRPCGHPLTLRRSFGAFSFQQQPTREESP